MSKSTRTAAEHALYASEVASSGPERSLIGPELSMDATSDSVVRIFQRK